MVSGLVRLPDRAVRVLAPTVQCVLGQDTSLIELPPRCISGYW